MNLWLLGAGGGLRMEGKDSQGIWDGHVHTVIFKIDNQQGPTVKKISLKKKILNLLTLLLEY